LYEVIAARPWADVVHCLVLHSTDWSTIPSDQSSSSSSGGWLMYGSDYKYQCSVVLPHQPSPNGITHYQDKYLYIALSGSHEFAVYNRNPVNGSLSLLLQQDVGTSIDNLNIEPLTGIAYAGCHIQPLKWTEHKDDNSVPSPTHILQLTPPSVSDGGIDSGKPFKIEELLLTNGTDYPSSTSAVVYNNRYLAVGTVFVDGIFICKL